MKPLAPGLARSLPLLSPVRRVVGLVAAAACCLLIRTPSLQAAGLPTAPEDLVSPAHQLDPVHPAAPWDGILKQLQSKGNIAATFTENRYFPFKKIPVVLTGEIRLSREKGLSLHYLTPEDRLMVVDDHGVLFRLPSGRSREGPSDPRALSATDALVHVMRFDLAELSKQFATYAAGDAAQWYIAFDPKDEALSHTLSRLIVTGQGDQVRRIQMRKSAVQSVEILIADVRENVTFTPEELKRFFR